MASTLDPTSLPAKWYDETLLSDNVTIDIKRFEGNDWTKDKIPASDLFIQLAHPPATPVGSEQETSSSHQSEQQNWKVPADLDAMVEGVFTEIVAKHQFNGKEGKQCDARVGGKGSHFGHAALVGVGCAKTTVDCETIHTLYQPSATTAPAGRVPAACVLKAGKAAGALAQSVKADTVVVSFRDIGCSAKHLQVFCEAFLSKLMVDDRFKSKKSTNNTYSSFKSLHILVSAFCCPDGDFKKAVADAKRVASGIEVARQLIFAPANYCNPATMANFARDHIAKPNGMECKILDMAECEKRKMGCLVAVGKGSITPPCVIHLTYKGEPLADGSPLKKIAFIGKGVTMDTGGYNLKVGSAIELMKWDMGGSGTVLGAAAAIGRVKPAGVEVHFIVGAVENMISDKAYRPGDILTASNGTTVEVLNTDAEGRLVLADCLVYAETLGLDLMVDLATLTGASMVALGLSVGSLFGTNRSATSTILQAAQDSGDSLWPMPLHSTYRPLLDSHCADIANVVLSPSYGGSITAALFLKEFVTKTPWCHIDMAAPVWDYKLKEPSGFGVRTLVTLAQKAAQCKF